MKYLWISIAILAIAFTFCHLTYLVVERDMGEILDYLNHVEQLYNEGDSIGAAQLSHEMYNMWETHRPYLAAVLKHADVDRADSYLRLVVRGIENNSVGVTDAITDARSMLDGIIRGEALTLANIM